MQVVCPNCGEAFDLAIDADETEFVIDCENCCRPMNVVVRARDGGVQDVEVSPA